MQELQCLTYSFSLQTHIAIREGEVRLVGEGSPSEGIVELYSRQYGWATLCTTDWDDNDAQVACMQLGYTGGRSTTSRWACYLNVIPMVNSWGVTTAQHGPGKEAITALC